MSLFFVRQTFLYILVAAPFWPCTASIARHEKPTPLQVSVSQDGSVSVDSKGAQHAHVVKPKAAPSFHEEQEQDEENDDEHHEELEDVEQLASNTQGEKVMWGRRRRSRRRAIPCVWDNWKAWSKCNKACASGTTSRSRGIKTQPAHGGAKCEGSATENKPCNTHPCPVNCAWRTWGAWTKCSKSCGGGEQKRSRTKSRQEAHGGKCSGGAEEKKKCQTQPCPVDCVFEEWVEWENCTKTCGNGTRVRKREEKTAAKHGGKKCDGEPEESEECNTEKCKACGSSFLVATFALLWLCFAT